MCKTADPGACAVLPAQLELQMGNKSIVVRGVVANNTEYFVFDPKVPQAGHETVAKIASGVAFAKLDKIKDH